MLRVAVIAVLLSVALPAFADDEGWTFVDNFDGDKLDEQAWEVVYKQWGGKGVNGGVHPDNVEVSDGTLKLHALGDLYEGPIRGVDKDMSIREDGKRVGAAIATAEFFGSGRYEVKMKVAPVMGVCTAIWTFNYEEYYPGDMEYDDHCKDTPVKCNPEYWASNSEIDMEFPTSLDHGDMTKDISFSNGRLNSWVGENIGEYEDNFMDLGGNQADGNWHTYVFEWHTGDELRTKESKRVDFYVDGRKIKTIDSYVPTIAGRLWLGAWFPSEWAGNPNFEKSFVEVDYVKIKRYHEDGDDWILPSYPEFGWADTYPYPQTEVFFDKFDAETLDPTKWKVVQKNWGGQLGKLQSWNGGIRPDNVKLPAGQGLEIEAHGALYDRGLLGMNKDTTRRNDGTLVGGAIATTQYFGSGKYEVRMKVAPEYGVCTAMWTFNYEEYYPPDPRYEQYCPNKPEYCVVNHEVDFELPSGLNKTDPTQGVSFENARMNVFVGVEEDQEKSDFKNVGFNMNDGQYHTYRFDWHTGGNGEEKRVDWYIDDKFIHSINSDAVPTNAARFWLAAWFPNGWAGNANFNTTKVEVDFVRITPFNEEGDTIVPETYPTDGFAMRTQYPRRQPSPEQTEEKLPELEVFVTAKPAQEAVVRTSTA